MVKCSTVDKNITAKYENVYNVQNILQSTKMCTMDKVYCKVRKCDTKDKNILQSTKMGYIQWTKIYCKVRKCGVNIKIYRKVPKTKIQCKERNKINNNTSTKCRHRKNIATEKYVMTVIRSITYIKE